MGKKGISAKLILLVSLVITLFAGLAFFFFKNSPLKLSSPPRAETSPTPTLFSPSPVSEELDYKNVIVGVKITPSFQPEGNLTPEEQNEQRASIKKTVDQVLSGLDSSLVSTRYESVPFFAIKADNDTLEYLENHPLVVDIQEDSPDSTYED